MKIPVLTCMFSLVAGMALVLAQDPTVAKRVPKLGKPGLPAASETGLPKWGKAVNPDGDCKFFLTKGELLISVPGGGRPHDLAAEVGKTNAPRVVQPVRGDFVLQVKIEGRFTPGDQSTLQGRTGYNGAGIVLMTDKNNVICLARAVLQREGEEAQPYANFEIRADGKLQRIGQTGDHPLPATGPVYLRLERRGQKVNGAVSRDGSNWDLLEPKDLPASWGSELQAGVVAISTSKEEFNPRFSELQILQ